MKKGFIYLFTAIVLVGSCKEKKAEQDEQKADPAKLELLDNLQQQVKQNPDSASIRMKLVNTLDSLEKYPEAISQLDSLIKRDSANNGLWYAKAQLLESNKDTAAAINSYEKALTIYPSVDAQLSLANLMAEAKDKRSLLICQNVSKMGLGREIDAHCDFIAGVYNARTGNKKLAVSLFDRCINNNYTYMEAYMEKGFIQYDNKNYTDALKIFQNAITVNNTYADAYYWQAKCFEAMGNKQEAITNYQRSLGLDKTLKEARQALDRLGT